MGFKFKVVHGQLPRGLVFPEEPLAVSFPEVPTGLPDRCVDLYWIDDLEPFAATLNVAVVDRRDREMGAFDVEVAGHATERRISPASLEGLWDRYGRSLFAAIVVLSIVARIMTRIRYHYRVATGKRE